MHILYVFQKLTKQYNAEKYSLKLISLKKATKKKKKRKFKHHKTKTLTWSLILIFEYGSIHVYGFSVFFDV